MGYVRLTLALALLLAGCDDPTEGVPRARIVEEPAEASRSNEGDSPEPTDPSGASGLAIDTSRSTFEFIGSKVTASHSGHFGEWGGVVQLREPLEQSEIQIEIQMASIEADVPRLTAHLRTDDFFDVARYPTARFETTAIAAAPVGAGDATHLVTGRLTVRDTTETITFPCEVTLTVDEVRARAEFTVDRQRWGINYPGMEDDLIRDQVVIRFDVRASRTAG